jgi:hypothetical protein
MLSLPTKVFLHHTNSIEAQQRVQNFGGDSLKPAQVNLSLGLHS